MKISCFVKQVTEKKQKVGIPSYQVVDQAISCAIDTEAMM